MARSSGNAKKKEGRIARHLRVAREVRDEPHSALTLIRGWLVRLWSARGGGLYGLGVVAAFLILEARMLTDDLAGSASFADFVMGEIIEFVFRLGFMSFVNGLLALLWPLYVIERLGIFGIVTLIAAYLAFEYGLRPMVEARLPELAEARQAKAEARREKAARKQARAERKARRREKKAERGRS